MTFNTALPPVIYFLLGGTLRQNAHEDLDYRRWLATLPPAEADVKWAAWVKALKDKE